METDSDANGISLLVVEDELESRDLLGKVLSQRYEGLTILMEGDGASGLESFKRNRPQIVITDIHLPGTDGIQMATEIRLFDSESIIIALTAHSDTQYLLDAIEIGINHYVLKPVNLERLVNILDKSLDEIHLKKIRDRDREKIRLLNTELARKAAKLEDMNQELASFNYTVAHDLRAPLVSMQVMVELLQQKHGPCLDASVMDNLCFVQSEILRMDSIIRSLLEFSSDSKKKIEKKWINLSSIAHEIKEKLIALEPLRQVTFNIADGVCGYCDPYLLKIVLENLLRNAWKYTARHDTAHIEFGSVSTEEDIIYFVRDNGPGFSKEEASKLFNLFQRLQNEETEGFGIGLATVHRIIQRHQGRIWAEGEVGKGASFFFTL